MYGYESCTIKKAEHRRIDTSELWFWRRLLSVPWTARRYNQSILKEISPEFTGRTDARAEAPVLWPPDAKSWLIIKDPKAGKDWRQEKKGTTDGWMLSPTHWTWVWASSRRWRRTGKPGVLQSMGSQGVGHDWVIKQQRKIYRIQYSYWKIGQDSLMYKGLKAN